MRSIWKGAINFGMVSIPAKLYSATDDRRVSFHQIHADCGSRIQMPKWCPNCNRKVEAFELRKGYEIAKGQHIILEEADFQSLPLKSLKTIEVTEFVEPGHIDLRAYADSYLLSPEEVGLKAFRLLRDAMERTAVVAVAKLAYREREHLSAIRPYNGVMLLQTLHYADELRPCDELVSGQQVMITEKEEKLTLALIGAMKADTFDHFAYQDDYRQALERVIEAKMNGEVITPQAEPQPSMALDFEAILEESLKLVGAKR